MDFNTFFKSLIQKTFTYCSWDELIQGFLECLADSDDRFAVRTVVSDTLLSNATVGWNNDEWRKPAKTVRLGYNELGYNELGYNELGYNELGYNEQIFR